MESFYMIIPIALLFCLLAGWVWVWASKSGQFDDLDREARRILEDDDLPAPVKKNSQSQASADSAIAPQHIGDEEPRQ